MAGTKAIRGVQTISKTLKDGTTKTRYRVQIKNKDIKVDKYFDDPLDAREFLLLSKSQYGRKGILQVLNGDDRKGHRLVTDNIQQPPLADYFEIYVHRYIQPKFKSYLEQKDPTPESKFKLRQLRAEICMFKKIRFTRIKIKGRTHTIENEYGEVVDKSQLLFKARSDGYYNFGMLKPQEITSIEINEFVKVLLEEGLAPSSVESYVGKLSNVYKKMKFMDEGLANLPNPCQFIDKDLIKAYKSNYQKPPPKIISPIEEKRLFEVLSQRENEDLFNAIKFMLYTGIRRSELVLLYKQNTYDTFIYIYTNKSNRPRTVHLIPEAQAIVKVMLSKYPDVEQVFPFVSVASFASQFLKCMRKNKMEHIKLHSLRKTFISRLVREIGAKNSLLIAQIMGNKSQNIERAIARLPIIEGGEISNQEQLLRQVGHSNSRVTEEHYLNLDSENF